MALKIAKKPATATISKQVKDKGTVISEDVKEETVEIPTEDGPSSDPFCEVGVDMSYTHNLGNYQSAKVGVSIKVPCRHGEIDEVFDYSKTWVNSKMETMIDELSSS